MDMSLENLIPDLEDFEMQRMKENKSGNISKNL